METIRLNEVGTEVAAQRAAEILRDGGVVLYPTDTLYGLGADALSDEAVAKIKRIKGRDEKKPIHCIVEHLAAAEEFVVLNKAAELLAHAFWPGALTLILAKRSEYTTGIARDMDTFGVRVPHHAFCNALAREFAAPYTTTSANKSGDTSAQTIEAILAQLDVTAHEIDLVIDAGELPERKPSTIVDISRKTPVILREGAIPADDIWEVLKPGL